MHPVDYTGPALLASPHLIGIGDAGMPGLAQLLRERGARLTGCAHPQDIPAHLADLGIGVVPGHDRGHVRADMSALVSAANSLPRQAETTRAREMCLPILDHTEALGLLLAATPTSIAVAGSHSTTHTAGALTRALGYRNPAWALLTPPVGRPAGHHSGGDLLIAELGPEADPGECCEPTLTVITAVTANPPHHDDHETALDELEALARRSQIVVLPTWDTGCAQLAQRLAKQKPGPRVVSVGQGRGSDLRITKLATDKNGSTLTLHHWDGKTHALRLLPPGRHAAKAAALAMAGALALDSAASDVARGLEQYRGIERSLTVLGRQEGVTVVESLARHPAEIADDLTAARTLATGRIVAVYEPSHWSRTNAQARAIGGQLATADELVLLPLHDRRRADTPDLSTGTDAMARAAAVSGLDNHVHTLDLPGDDLPAAGIEHLLVKLAHPGDTVLLIGTGHTVRLGPRLLFALGAPGVPVPQDL
ncbi:glutamate ligase domain-containing protein [Streptacidiphilus albus]|uniref:glutamate ligase domain-containing protein n=1 Tax=Streptacidiphilus albus TaxID=105425 RepID=UPI00054BF5DA|nr:Mur ligase domain-containing protein [Streptacidiphilus albus]